MSDALGIRTETTVFLSVEKVVREMDAEDIGVFCSAVAERLDKEFTPRFDAASKFSEGLSEDGCRFLADVVTSYFQRHRR